MLCQRFVLVRQTQAAAAEESRRCTDDRNVARTARFVADKDDLREAVRGILERAGISFAELAEQGRTGDFKTVTVRMAWVAIGDLGELAD